MIMAKFRSSYGSYIYASIKLFSQLAIAADQRGYPHDIFLISP